MSRAFRDLEALVGTLRFPPVDSWNPNRVGEIDIRIREDGVWFHEQREITRTEISKLFASILVFESGDYFLKTPEEKLRIQVDDAPFLITDYEADGKGKLQDVVVKTNFDECVHIDGDHRVFMEESTTGNRPYVHIRSGLNALVARSVFYRMANELMMQCSDELVMWSCGKKFVLATVEEIN